MRGKVNRMKEETDIARITPAYAGKSFNIAFVCIALKDHPRVCGEKKLAIFDDETGEGSPPRMRGKVERLGVLRNTFGITPAYAGKSKMKFFDNSRSKDHPRVCGEKLLMFYTSHSVMGSPPRMRGKVLYQLLRMGYAGITPAYAGKSGQERFSRPRDGDHPRVCGEKRLWLKSTTPISGSPPRMRGKVHVPCGGHRQTGITPAYAGKSFGDFPDEVVPGDHPRVCGEKTKKIP